MSNPHPSIRIERFHAPHGPEEPYTPDEMAESIRRHGADRIDMMNQSPDMYYDEARTVAAEIVARDRAKEMARNEQARREKLGKTFIGRFILEFL